MKSIEEIRAEAAAFNNGAVGFDNNTRLNAYECDGESGFGGGPDKPGCGAYIVTVDREPGVTPFMVSCGLCGQMAHSKFYRVAPSLVPTHEWYRPDTLSFLEPYEREHVEKGGLLLRTIDGAGWTPRVPVNKEDADNRLASLKRGFDVARKVRDLAELHAAVDLDTKCLEGKIKREDYPNRQQYRAAVRAERKPLMKPPGFA